MNDGERDLWCAVIRQAFVDATTHPTASRAEGLEARRWLTRPNRDFSEVCALAGLEPDAVRAEAIELCAAADIGIERPKIERKRGKPRPGKRIELNGLNLTITEWANRTGLSRCTINSRLLMGRPAERILTVPAQPKGRRLGRQNALSGA